MNVLFAASEVTPIVKVGGLGDVVGALPIALRGLGHDVRIVLPLYDVIDHHVVASERWTATYTVPFDGQEFRVGIHEGRLPGSGVPIYLLDCPPLFSGGGVYYEKQGATGLESTIRRFVFFSAAVAQLLPHLGWRPEILHCHDWHVALIPSLLKEMYRATNAPATLLTIHNLQSEGQTDPALVSRWLQADQDRFSFMALRDRYGRFNTLQHGIVSAQAVNTVSPTYAQEILTPEYGEGLENDLRQRSDVVEGILNGIDVDRFNPATDATIAAQYTAETVKAGKAKNKATLQKRLGLSKKPTAPLFGLVGRLTNQKGLDLLIATASDLVARGGQLAILGSGQPDVEAAVISLAKRFPTGVAAVIKFDAALAQGIYAGADFFLMPSRFEPCGLGQMIAMRYGTLPIVRATGGLRDTVVDLASDGANGTGFVFNDYRPAALHGALESALALYQRPTTMAQSIARAMAQDFSWDQSALNYLNLYGRLAKNQSL